METFTPYNQIFVFWKVMYVQYGFSYLIVTRPKLTFSFDVHKIKANSNENKNEKRKRKTKTKN
jgi:hypothetical protein